MKRESTTGINNYKIKRERKEYQKLYLDDEFEQALITVKLFRDHSRENHKRVNIRGHYTVCMRSCKETGQRTKKAREIGCKKGQSYIQPSRLNCLKMRRRKVRWGCHYFSCSQCSSLCYRNFLEMRVTIFKQDIIRQMTQWNLGVLQINSTIKKITNSGMTIEIQYI